MKLPHEWKLRLSPLSEAALGKTLVEQHMALRDFSEERLVVASSYGEFVFDRVNRQVLRDGAPVSDFASVQSVDIATLPGREDLKSWSITLYRGFFDRITVGRTYDDGDASVIAARIASVLGCRVVAMGLRRF